MAKKKTQSRSAKARRPEASMRIIVLAGKDPYLRSLHTDSLRTKLEEAFGDVDVIHFSGAANSIADVLDECRSFGLMQQHKLIVVDEADQLVKEDARPIIERYAQAPTDQATLLLRTDIWRAGKLDKLIDKVGAVIKCDGLTESQATRWAFDRAQKQWGATIEPDAAERLVERVGPNVGSIDSALAKLATLAGPGAAITSQMVTEMVGRSREEEVWAIQSELIVGDANRAVGSVHEALGLWRVAPVLVSFAMMDLARKLFIASRMLDEGATPQATYGPAKIWGPAREAILRAARRASPADLAALFDEAVRTDVRSKTGVGDGKRSLEALAVRFASVVR